MTRIIRLGLSSILAIAIATSASAQSKNTIVESKAAKSRGTSAKDENVKSDVEKNDMNSTLEPPPAKGGKASRGNLCGVHFDNRTPWKLRTYVDGNHWGVVGPWGDLYALAIAGGTVLYAKATFTDGSELTWGPTVIKCPADGAFQWKLTK